MQRLFALVAPATRHPFRHDMAVKGIVERRRRTDDQDLKLFAMAFTAFFVCIYTFIL